MPENPGKRRNIRRMPDPVCRESVTECVNPAGINSCLFTERSECPRHIMPICRIPERIGEYISFFLVKFTAGFQAFFLLRFALRIQQADERLCEGNETKRVVLTVPGNSAR